MTPTIPEAAVQNALDAFEKTATTRDGVIAALTAATPFLTGVTIEQLQQAHTERQKEWCPDQKPDLSFRGNEMAGEVGEACNVIKKLERERQGWRGSRATKQQLADELADVIHTAVLCAITAGIELAPAVVNKFNTTSEKNGLSTTLSALAPSPRAQALEEAHTDDLAVDRFASAMKIKLKIKRAQGRGGWEDKKTVTREYLSYLLLQNCLKGSTLNVANLAMMLHQRGEEIVIDEETSIMLGAGLSSQPAATEWKSIDSAPKDGTVILVYRDDVGVFTAHYVEEDAYLSSPMNPPEGDFYWFSTCGDDLTGNMPTHWRPLPQAPGMAV